MWQKGSLSVRPISHSLDHATRILIAAAFSRLFAQADIPPHANAGAGACCEYLMK
jgi:hypothetical protein